MSDFFNNLPIDTTITIGPEGSLGSIYHKIDGVNRFRRKYSKGDNGLIVAALTDEVGELEWGFAEASSGQRWKGKYSIEGYPTGAHVAWPSMLPVGTILVSKSERLGAIISPDLDGDGDQRWLNHHGSIVMFRRPHERASPFRMFSNETRRKRARLYVPGIKCVHDAETLRIASELGFKVEAMPAASVVLAANATKFFVEEWA